MTETEWLASGDPVRMLDRSRNEASNRKLRLFAVACCRRVWHLMTDERSRIAVQAAERCAEQGGSTARLSRTVRDGAMTPVRDARTVPESHAAAAAVMAIDDGGVWGVNGLYASGAHIAAGGAACQAAFAVKKAMRHGGGGRPGAKRERQAQANLLRCIFGLFHVPAIDPLWLSASVKQLAEAIYAERAFDHLPILGDALEEAGCSDAGILNHCRQSGDHVRGCWVVDLLLSKS